MPDQGQYSWLWESLEGLRKAAADGHSRLRQDMSIQFDKQHEELKSIARDVSEIQLMVERLKTQHELEEKASMKRGAWAGMLAGFVLSLMLKFGEWLWGTR